MVATLLLGQFAANSRIAGVQFTCFLLMRPERGGMGSVHVTAVSKLCWSTALPHRQRGGPRTLNN